MIERYLYSQIIEKIQDPKAIILIGPRQVGKTTLLKKVQQDWNSQSLWWNADEPDIRAKLSNINSTQLGKMIGLAKLLIIDEAQRVENIGLTIKLIVDNFPGVKVIATGSSSFELANKINEPLTGRKWEYFMYPLSTAELVKNSSEMEEGRLLEHRLLYGFYPDVINNKGSEAEVLKQLSDSYLYKDILMWENIQKPAKLERLVQAIAFQIGQPVSINELAQISGLDFHTVERYISLLEKAFIVFQLSPYSRNLRNEIRKSRKIYFYDNGIRNAVINQFNPIQLRQDVGSLFENFLMVERKKRMEAKKIHFSRYFWRNHPGQEVDYLEEIGTALSAFEFKWSPTSKPRFPKSFIEEYSPQIASVINRDNYLDFILKE